MLVTVTNITGKRMSSSDDITLTFKDHGITMTFTNVIDCVVEDIQDEVDGLIENFNTNGLNKNVKVSCEEYNHLLKVDLPFLLTSINGTGYAYEDLVYTIQYNGRTINGNTSQSYKQFTMDKYNHRNSQYFYPSTKVDLMIVNGEEATCEKDRCVLIFGIKVPIV